MAVFAFDKTRARSRQGLFGSFFRRGDPENLSSGQLAAYGLPMIPLQAMLAPLAIFLAPFYTGELGITLTTWALILGVTRIVDIVLDPLVGIICDRLPSRWGRRRHWVVGMAPFVMLSGALLFMPQIVTTKPTFLYVLLAMILFNLSTSIQQLNLISWGGELSSRYTERTRIMGWRAGFAALAKLMAFGIPAAMEWLIPGSSTGDKLEALTWAVVVLLPFTTLIAVISVPEKPADANPAAAPPKFTLNDLGETLWRMVTNKYLGRILLVELLQAGPTAVKGALFVFYVTYIMQASGYTATLLLFVYGATLLSTPIWMRLARGREKHRLLAISVLLYGCSQASMMFWGPNQLVFFIIAIAMNGVMNAGPNFLMHSIMVDVVDSDTVLTGKQQTGAFFAVLETTTKATPALVVMAIFPILQAVGFDPTGKNNTPQSIEAVRIAFALAPTIPVILAGLLLWNFPLGSKRQAELRAAIEARAAVESTSV